jgi:hypothetical protein
MSEPARFRVRGTWWFGSRCLWIVYGEIESGEIRPGMTAAAVDADPFVAPVDRLGWMLISVSAGVEHLALVFRPRSRRELDAWRARSWEDRSIAISTDAILHPCPCCGLRTLMDPERGSYDVCGVCDWEDDGVQFGDPDYGGGANENSLNECRRLRRRVQRRVSMTEFDD